MMTSKIEDRLRKNGVKIKKYYKWLRWSMILRKIRIISQLLFRLLEIECFGLLSLFHIIKNHQNAFW